MQPQDTREALEVVVNEGVVQLLRGFFARGLHDPMFREKGELGAGVGTSRRSQRCWMHAQSAQVAHDEACRGQSGTGEAQARVLWVRFKGNRIVE